MAHSNSFVAGTGVSQARLVGQIVPERAHRASQRSKNAERMMMWTEPSFIMAILFGANLNSDISIKAPLDSTTGLRTARRGAVKQTP
jgi:hypothetical protein